MSVVAIAVVGVGIAGAATQARAASNAAEKQANAINDAAQISGTEAQKARAEILDRMVPALQDYNQSMQGLSDKVKDGSFDVIDTYMQTTEGVSAALDKTGANVRQAILGSSASSSGTPRQQFNQNYKQSVGLSPDQIEKGRADYTQRIGRGITQRPDSVKDYAPPSAEAPIGGPPALPASTADTGFRGADTRLLEGQQGGLSQLATGTSMARGDIYSGEQRALESITGAETTARGDITGAETIARGDIESARGQALGGLDPYSQAGQSALQQEAALSGALGPEAQQEALNAFTESPGQEYLRERQEQTLLRNASATGGLGGGRVRSALMEQAAGIASTQQQQYMENLRNLAVRGQQASTTGAGISMDAGTSLAGISTGAGTSLANIATQSGANKAGIQTNAASQLASLADSLGVRGADLTRATSTERAALAEKTGINLAQLEQVIGMAQSGNLQQFGSNVAGIQSGQLAETTRLGEQTATTGLTGQQNISQILANLATNQGTTLANLAVGKGEALAAGQQLQGQAWGQALSNVGTVGLYKAGQSGLWD